MFTRTRFGEQHVGRRESALERSTIILIGLDENRPFAIWLDEKDLVRTDSFVPKKLVRMRTDEELTGLKVVKTFPAHPTNLGLKAVEKLRQLSDDLRMKRQLGLLQKKGAFPLEHRPHEAKEPKRTVGELRLVLTRIVGSPVFESANEMGCPLLIHLHFQILQLGNGILENRSDATEPRLSSLFVLIPDPLDDVSTKRIVFDRGRRKLLRLTDNLRDDVLIGDGVEKIGDLSEFSIGEDLLQRSLSQQHLVGFIVRIGAVNDSRYIGLEITDDFLTDDGSLLMILVELDPVEPAGRVGVFVQNNLYHDARTLPGGAAPQRGNSPPFIHGLAQSILGEVPQKTERIEKIGFSGCVRPNQKRPPGQVGRRRLKVLPVLKLDPANVHGERAPGKRSDEDVRQTS